jgi:hypothetical protein
MPFQSRPIYLFPALHGHVLLSLVNIRLHLSLLLFSLSHTVLGLPNVDDISILSIETGPFYYYVGSTPRLPSTTLPAPSWNKQQAMFLSTLLDRPSIIE